MRQERGFTLLEILVAITLLALLLAAVLPALQQGMGALRSGDERLRALLVARSLLAEHTSDSGEEPNADLALSGEAPLAWRIERSEFVDASEAEGEGDEEPANDSELRLVRVTVHVRYGDEPREIALSTLSLEREATR